MSTDYYKLLGVNRNATEAEIKKAFRKKALELHPDRHQGDKQAEENFKEVNEAYAVLSDPNKRRQYDAVGHTQFHTRYSQEDIFRDTDFHVIFQEFGGMGKIFEQIFRQQGAPARGEDTEAELTITQLEAYTGTEKNLRLYGSALKVKIPAGIANGGQLRLVGKGKPSPHRMAGDLYIKVKVLPDPIFRRIEARKRRGVGEASGARKRQGVGEASGARKRQGVGEASGARGDDVETNLVLKISEALGGCSKEVKTPDGRTKTVKVPSLVAPGVKLRLQGLGFPSLTNPQERGDLYIAIVYHVPQMLSAKQKEAIEFLRDHDL